LKSPVLLVFIFHHVLAASLKVSSKPSTCFLSLSLPIMSHTFVGFFVDFYRKLYKSVRFQQYVHLKGDWPTLSSKVHKKKSTHSQNFI